MGVAAHLSPLLKPGGVWQSRKAQSGFSYFLSHSLLVISKQSTDKDMIWSSSGIIFILHPIIKDIEQLSIFCVQVHNLFKKWVWMQVEPFQTEEVTQPSPDTHHQFIHIWSYSENLKFCSLNLDSPQNLGLDAS